MKRSKVFSLQKESYKESEVKILTNIYWKKHRWIMLCVLSVFLALSMTAQAAQEGVKAGNRIAVISFQAVKPESGSGNTVFCPICGAGASGGKILEGSEKIVEEVFVNKLGEFEELEIIPASKVQSVYKKISSSKQKGTFADTLSKTGKEIGADFLAVGYVYRFVERVGYGYSSEHPASVAFEIHLIKTTDGSIIWRGFFDKTQKSLLENIFEISSFFRGGAKWVTAQELTELGMDDVLDTFPDLEN
jgi:hypothetical protein